MKRQYIRNHKAWYAKANKIFNPEISIGIYDEDGCTQENLESGGIV